jgi:hypothetical protein
MNNFRGLNKKKYFSAYCMPKRRRTHTHTYYDKQRIRETEKVRKKCGKK